MFDDHTKRGMILRTALRLAEQKGWRALSLAEVAQNAGVGLADLHREFPAKAGILRALSEEIDRAVLGKVGPVGTGPSRDRVFDVLMTRFEVMAPYKGALKRIAADLRAMPVEAAALACNSLRSQYWMLIAAGVEADGAQGCLRVPGLAAIYARVFPIWLEDEDPGLARTMAALDRSLRRGERVLGWVDAVCSDAQRFFAGLKKAAGNYRSRKTKDAGGAAERPGV